MNIEKLKTSSTHILRVDNNRAYPFITNGDCIFLEKIQRKDYSLLESDIYVCGGI